ncbi:hypothetical protein AT2G07638 [Arabidopsis thaliana]|uniref:Uncharacterized protein n=1 Tax=Arabidopsis thaliana TaxID=3702 RepID=A0A1P8B281_ARATH|nr:uncharacterized protein AT2G07638 [Arabidopsis thaliana]ANM63007.1 hypothetical protein AT2G07638 [Arabidopsis thaliana]|eukprot:NP_001325124.1 hypothetical protein AT2G07638 [Arabidopsis thaliana]
MILAVECSLILIRGMKVLLGFSKELLLFFSLVWSERKYRKVPCSAHSSALLCFSETSYLRSKLNSSYEDASDRSLNYSLPHNRALRVFVLKTVPSSHLSSEKDLVSSLPLLLVETLPGKPKPSLFQVDINPGIVNKKRLAGLVAYPYRLIVLFVAVVNSLNTQIWFSHTLSVHSDSIANRAFFASDSIPENNSIGESRNSPHSFAYSCKDPAFLHLSYRITIDKSRVCTNERLKYACKILRIAAFFSTM